MIPTLGMALASLVMTAIMFLAGPVLGGVGVLFSASIVLAGKMGSMKLPAFLMLAQFSLIMALLMPIVGGMMLLMLGFVALMQAGGRR